MKIKSFYVQTCLLALVITALNAEQFSNIRPLVNKYCVSCHGPNEKKASLRMDTLSYDLVNGEDTQMWQEALDLVNTNEMPTRKAKVKFTKEDRDTFVDLLSAELRKAIRKKLSAGGRNPVRRLTRYEYNNSMRNILGQDRDFAQNLPPESLAKEGFKNNSAIMGFSPLHLEHFEKIARESLEAIINIPDKKPRPIHWSVEPENAFLVHNDKKLSSVQRQFYNKVQKLVKLKHKQIFGFDRWSTAVPGKQKDEFSKHFYRVRTPLEQYKKNNRAYLKYPDKLTDEGIILSGNYPFEKSSDIFSPPVKLENFPSSKIRIGYQPDFRMEMYDTPNIPRTGTVTIRIKAGGIKGKNGELPVLYCEFSNYDNRFSIASKKVGEKVVSHSISKTGIYEFRIQAENLPIRPLKQAHHLAPVVFSFFNSYKRGTANIKHEDLPKLFIDSAEIIFDDYEQWPPENYQRLMHPDGKKEFKPELILNSFAERAFRRPLTMKEKQQHFDFYTEILKKSSDKKEALISTLTLVLCSPSFLMIIEPNVTVSDKISKRIINNYELASRLSYFLWSDMPDKTLLDLADKGTLKEDRILNQQITRMLKDPKIAQFSRNFTSQWLHLDSINQVAVNPAFFDFKEKSREIYAAESIAFVNQVIKDELSIFNFIHSDFAMLNPHMARHYQIPGISGSKFKKVAIKKKYHRGGLLTHAGILLANSEGGETHPIKRGIWMLENILNSPPPPAPPGVPELGRINPKLSLKERLREHAKEGACKSCHSRIDPWGVVFENYNALGQWREGNIDPHVKARHRKVQIDPSTKLRNGKEIKNLDELKKYLITERRDQLLKSISTKVLSYALGRYTDTTDQQEIDKICNAVKKDGWKFSSVIRNVILSETFRTK